MNPNPANNPWSERLKNQFHLPIDESPLDESAQNESLLDELAARNDWQLSDVTDFADEVYGEDVYYDGMSYDPSVDELYLHCEAPVYLPESYEPNYAYPLIIWLSGAQRDEHDLLDLMPRISDQNFVAVSVLGQSAASDQSPTGDQPSSDAIPRQSMIEAIQQKVHEIVCQLRRQIHIHSERIYLAGLSDEATSAVQLLLHQPEWFAGALLFGGTVPNTPHPFAQFREFAGKRILIQAGARNPRLAMPDVLKMGRLLHSAGMSVSTRVFDVEHDVTSSMLTDVNHWLMDGICEANLV